MPDWNSIPDEPSDYNFVPFIITLQGVIFAGPGINAHDRLDDLMTDLEDVVARDEYEPVTIDFPAEVRVEGDDEETLEDVLDDLVWLGEIDELVPPEWGEQAEDHPTLEEWENE